MYYYLSMFFIFVYVVICTGAEEWHLSSTRVETINQSINQ